MHNRERDSVADLQKDCGSIGVYVQGRSYQLFSVPPPPPWWPQQNHA